MGKIWAIAKTGIKECLRYKTLYGILVMAILFVYLGKGCNPGTIRGEGIFFDERVLRDMAMGAAYHGIVFWSILVCGMLSAHVVSREIEQGTLVMTLSRPLKRSAFMAGKLISALIVSCGGMLILGSVFFALFYFEGGGLNNRICFSFLIAVVSLVMFALMSMMLSLVMPRLMTPVVCVVLYFFSLWSSVPFHSDKIRFIWEPSDNVHLSHMLLPRFGDLQFLGAAYISRPVTFSELAAPLLSTVLYCMLFWAISWYIFQRLQLQND
jgi:ABC-type transport system involved in multi-copper enzyme maturation permease subunit